jgi:succinate-semialdehyde dehydrogenase/glutarate-semialdehyde dehydrogenase
MPFVATNPATEEIIAEYEGHTPAQVDAALDVATAAFHKWRLTPIEERARLMTRAAEILEEQLDAAANLMTSEMGKTLKAARGEATKCATTMRYYAEHAPTMLQDEIIETSGSCSGVRYDPLGAILAVMPWNFPMWQFIRVCAPTVMAGNVVVLKHASNVPGCAKFLEDLFLEAGFPPGVVTNLFIGHAQIEGIIADDRIAAVTLTGSDGAGRSVATAAGSNLKKTVLELGGSDPFIVASSADVDHAVPLAVTARLQNNGQSCIASKRFIVVRDRADEFVEKFVAAMAAVPTGDPLDPDTVLGPVVSAGQLSELTEQVADSVAKGATVRTGGAPLDRKGYFFPATVLTNVPANSRAGCEELFGPVAVVHVVDDLRQAIELANDTPWGLGGAIYATDQGEIDEAVAGLDVGMVFVNAIVASMPELPFGGTKASGYGRELGELGVREFTNVKSYYVA